jgi:hypothetical protein
MSYVELTDEQKKVVWRYVETWRRWRKLPHGYRSFADLENDLAQGSGVMLCGLLLEPGASHVISADAKDPKFFAAIFRDDDSAVPDMTAEELNQARRYIIYAEGTAPIRWWWGSRPFPRRNYTSLGTWTRTASRPLHHWRPERNSVGHRILFGGSFALPGEVE